MIGVFDDLAVDAHAAGANPASGVGAGAQTGLGEDALESFKRARRLRAAGAIHGQAQSRIVTGPMLQ
jgi:hypothetical protein